MASSSGSCPSPTLALITSSSSSSSLLLQSTKHRIRTKQLKNPPISSSSSSLTLQSSVNKSPHHHLSLQLNCYTSAPASAGESIQPPPPPPPTIVFIKGLALSTSEGILKNAFSEFGEVSKVKIVSDKRTKQSLGYAYIWYTNGEAAQLAVHEMNGKFFDGRFIYVTIARPGACKIPRRSTPCKF